MIVRLLSPVFHVRITFPRFKMMIGCVREQEVLGPNALVDKVKRLYTEGIYVGSISLSLAQPHCFARKHVTVLEAICM